MFKSSSSASATVASGTAAVELLEVSSEIEPGLLNED
jgi:hypothetical protein